MTIRGVGQTVENRYLYSITITQVAVMSLSHFCLCAASDLLKEEGDSIIEELKSSLTCACVFW